MKKGKLQTYYVRTLCVNINYISTKGGKIEGKKGGKRKKKTKKKKGGRMSTWKKRVGEKRKNKKKKIKWGEE
jgi:hypothetical protein